MPFDVVAWSEAAPGTGTVGLTAGTGDTRYEFSGDYIRVKKEAPFLAGLFYAAETTPDNARIRQTSRIGAVDLQFIQSVDLNDLDPLPGFSNFMDNPIRLRTGEWVQALSVNGNDEDTIIAAILASGAFPRDRQYVSPTHIIHGESDQTLGVNAWTECTVAWDQTLPDGIYYIVGMKVGSFLSTSGLAAARLILDMTNWRPGVIAAKDEADKTSRMSAMPAPYEQWGLHKDLKFSSKTMPRLEMLSVLANTDHRIELQLVDAAYPRNTGNFDHATS